MSQPRPHYVRKCNASTSNPAVVAANARVKVEAVKAIKTPLIERVMKLEAKTIEAPLIDKPQGKPAILQLEEDDDYWPIFEKEKAEPSRKLEMEHADAQVVNPQIKNPNVEPVMNRGTAEQNEDEFWPLSGKPFFSMIIGKGSIKPRYRLNIPTKLHSVLPSARVPVVLNYCGKCWNLVYIGVDTCKRFDGRWKDFAIDNGLKVGDACVFELTEHSNSNLKFKVQILRGDFPSELLAKAQSGTSNAPIRIDLDDH